MFSHLAANAEHTPVANATSAATVLAANGRRVGLSIANSSASAILYVLLDNSSSVPAVSATVHTVRINGGGYWECPWNYLGAVFAIASAADGFAQITEFTV